MGFQSIDYFNHNNTIILPVGVSEISSLGGIYVQNGEGGDSMITATCSSQKQDAIRLKAHGETFSLRCMNLLDGGFCALTWDGVGGKKECPIAALENVIGDLSSSIRKQSA